MSSKDTILTHLNDGNLIAFIGAGVSRSFTDAGGKTHQGLPDARELVIAMSKHVKDIDANMPLEDAAFLLRKVLGDRDYRRFVEAQLDPPDLEPLPAHRYLAMLPFTSYISMNLDVLLERALTEANQDFHTVVREANFYPINLFHRQIILKPHGCISDFDSVVLSTDQLVSYADRSPLMDALLKVLLTNTPVLFVGFGLKDPDFRTLIQNLSRSLDGLPRSFAVALAPSRFDNEFWAQHNIELVDSDLTAFLKSLAENVTVTNFPLNLRPADFLNDPIFSQIGVTRMHALPTETQVTESFLDGLGAFLLDDNQTLDSAVAHATQAAQKVSAERPNYSAFRRVTDETIKAIEKAQVAGAGRDEAYDVYREIRDGRAAIAKRLLKNGRTTISRGDKILLYSQSVRVTELLLGVAPYIQESCEIFIAECRPKSPRIFFDAVFFAEPLLQSQYKIRFVPDSAITTLIATGRVSKILLGAHAICVDPDDTIVGFINTCGSLQIALASEKYHVPLFVVAERDKIEKPYDPKKGYSDAQEERLTIPHDIGLAPAVLRQLVKYPILNIGYDYVPAGSHITLITD